MKTDWIKVGLNTLYYSKAYHAFAPFTKGIGVIFTLHHVRPDNKQEFSPNKILKITPEFLHETIKRVRSHGYDIISMDEAHQRLGEGIKGPPFAVFTLDDANRSCLQYAYPVLKRENVPFTIYVPTAFPDGQGEIWWQALENIIARNSAITMNMKGENKKFESATFAQKNATYNEIYKWLFHILDEDSQRASIRELAERYDEDIAALCRDEVMTWDELKTLAADPLMTVGAHTVNHYALAKLSEEHAYEEIKNGAEHLAKIFGKIPEHFAYPYGNPRAVGTREYDLTRKFGFKTAVTTHKNVLFPKHKEQLTALPRVSLNGSYQSMHYVDVFLSGAPFALFDTVHRLKAKTSQRKAA